MPKRPLVEEEISVVNALKFGATTNSATINTALGNIGLINRRVLFIPNTDRDANFLNWTVDVDVTVTPNITLFFGPGGTLDIQPGVTWTQNGQVWAGQWQIWNTTPGGTLIYNAPGMRFDQWDGGSAGTNAPIIRGFLTSDSLRLTVGAGQFDIVGGIVDPEGIVPGDPGHIHVNGTAPATSWIKVDGVATTNGWRQMSARYGSGDPETVVNGSTGEIYVNVGPPATAWIKESGISTNTGWRQIQLSQTTVQGAWVETITVTPVVSVGGQFSLTAIGAFPAGSGQAFSAVGRVVTTLGGPGTISLGDFDVGSDIWMPSMSTVAGTVSETGDHMLFQNIYNTAARDVTINSNDANTFDGTGSINITTRAARLVAQ